MQQRIVPIVGGTVLKPGSDNFSLKFPVPIKIPDDVFYRITSSQFVFNGKQCIIRNKLKSSVLQIIEVGGDVVIVDGIGSYIAETGKVNIIGFNPTSVPGGKGFIKISVVPANPSTITPTTNNILVYDESGSSVLGTVL